MKKNRQQRYALISVWDKTGIIAFTKKLRQLNFLLISTGGTAKVLRKAKIPVIPVEKITGNPEAFDGRMKTISFALESGILFDRTKKNHCLQAKKMDVVPIDLVVCNFYPFAKLAADPKAKIDQLLEMIDIGGPTMVRAAAKNYQSVGVVVDPADYQKVIKEIKNQNWLSEKTRSYLAVKALVMTANYDSLISQTLARHLLGKNELRLHLTDGRKLRYGENPHQQGWFYQTLKTDRLSLANFRQLQGKEMSFNNYLDAEAAVQALASLENGQPACVIIKHGNPCGAAHAPKITTAFSQAWNSDSLAAFGGIIALNRPIDKKLAQLMLSENRFFEVLLIPAINQEAEKIFAKKKNLRILVNPKLKKPFLGKEFDFKKIRGGFLVQEPDVLILNKKNFQVVTREKPTKKQIEELLFAWQLCRVCKSNTIVLTKNQTLIGTGVGQQDRKRCCQLAIDKAGARAPGSVAASDGFFPFPDGPQLLADAGVTAIIQPGGSIKDNEVIKLANDRQIPMVFTGIRCFKH